MVICLDAKRIDLSLAAKYIGVVVWCTRDNVDDSPRLSWLEDECLLFFAYLSHGLEVTEVPGYKWSNSALLGRYRRA